MKLLIADDEEYTREGIVHAIDWEAIGVTDIIQAGNGMEAQRLAQWYEPDIILTDIRMPKQDGIALVSNILEKKQDCKIIFISGYMEIEYYKSALKLSAIDYIEKPIDIAVLEKAINRAIREINEKKKNDDNHVISLEYRGQVLFNNLISKVIDQKVVDKIAKEVGFSLNKEYICGVIWHNGKNDTIEKIVSKIKAISQERNYSLVYNIDIQNNKVEIIVGYQPKEEYRLQSMWNQIIDIADSIVIGIGLEVMHYRNISNSYKMACLAVNIAFFDEHKRIAQINEIVSDKVTIEPGIYSEFINILEKDAVSIRKWFNQLYQQFRDNPYYHREQVINLLSSLITALLNRYPSLYCEGKEIHSAEDVKLVLSEKRNINEVADITDELFKIIENKEDKEEKYSRVIRGVLAFIEDNYGNEDLSISLIAEKLHFSSAYLNVLFKQETHYTIKQYISNYRLQKAKEMLDNGYDRINEIAEKCGYANGNYFAKVFKEATDMTPLEYRNR